MFRLCESSSILNDLNSTNVGRFDNEERHASYLEMYIANIISADTNTMNQLKAGLQIFFVAPPYYSNN